jgi:hypothetical protein
LTSKYKEHVTEPLLSSRRFCEGAAVSSLKNDFGYGKKVLDRQTGFD